MLPKANGTHSCTNPTTAMKPWSGRRLFPIPTEKSGCLAGPTWVRPKCLRPSPIRRTSPAFVRWSRPATITRAGPTKAGPSSNGSTSRGLPVWPRIRSPGRCRPKPMPPKETPHFPWPVILCSIFPSFAPRSSRARSLPIFSTGSRIRATTTTGNAGRLKITTRISRSRF